MTKEKGRAGIRAALLINAGAFGLGALGGFCLAWWLSGLGALSFSGWMESYARGFTTPVPFWTVLWDALRWPLFIWLLGFTSLGIWMVPLMFALRGFFLCFCVAGLSGAAEGGFLLAFLLFGLSGLVTLPVFFYLGARSWEQAVLGRDRLLALPADWSGAYLFKSALALGCAVCCAGLEHWLLPVLLKVLVPLISGA